MPGSPFNPYDWLRAAQDWFHKTEKSSGFRVYLIYLLITSGFSVTIICFFGNNVMLMNFVVNILYAAFGSFIVLFAFKSIQDPSFCRSEKHIENVRKLELAEQKGDKGPQFIQGESIELTSDSNQKTLPNEDGGNP